MRNVSSWFQKEVDAHTQDSEHFSIEYSHHHNESYMPQGVYQENCSPFKRTLADSYFDTTKALSQMNPPPPTPSR